MKKTIMTGLLTGLLFTPTNTLAGGTAEITAGQVYASLDTRLSGTLGEKGGLFVWNIATVDYSGAASNFTLVDTTYQIKGRLSLVPLELQFVGNDGSARTGMQYYGEKDVLNTFLLGTIGASFTEFDSTAEMTVMVGYNPALTDRVSLSGRVENITNVGGQGHNYSLQKLRLGLSVDSVRFGASVDTVVEGNTMNFSYNIGAFVGVDF
jgi:hypothetical protein